MKSKNKIICILTLSLFALVSCKTKLDPGFVQREWATTFRELGLVPTFPPREDVVVGDVYAYDFDPNAAENFELMMKPLKKMTAVEKSRRLSMGMSSRLLRIDVTSIIKADYAKTISSPATSPDFNSILGNPAQAAADATVANLDTQVKELTKKIDDGKKTVAAAEDTLVKGQQQKARVDQEVTVTQAALTRKKDMLVDTSPFEASISTKIAASRAADDAYAAALLDQTKANAGTDQTKKDAAAAKVTEKNQSKIDANLALTRANEDLVTAKTQKRSTTDEVLAVDTALANQAKANADQLATEQSKANAVNAQSKLEAEVGPKVTAVNAKLEAAKVIQKAIAEAGVKMLYAQPAYGLENVYDASSLAKESLESEKSRVNRLRLVAFPDFSAVSVSSADLSALVPIDALSLGLNITSENVSRVSVKIPSAESYGISISDMLNSIATPTGKYSDSGDPCYTLKSELKILFSSAKLLYPATRTVVPARDDPPRLVYLRVLTEVFYARAMDVGIFASKSFGGRLNVNDKPKTAAEATTATPSTPATQPFATNPLLTDLSARVAATQTVPGGSIQVLSRNETSVGLRRVFDRPVAVGYRGLILKIDLNTNQILGITTDNSAVTAVPPN